MRRSRAGTFLTLFAFVFAAGTASRAQQRAPTPTIIFEAQARLVVVPVTVVDHRGTSITGLDRDAFTVTENGLRQDISSFSEDDAPVSMGVVFDMSGSMSGVLASARVSLRSVLKDANPGDEAFLYTVSTRPGASPFTRDLNEIMDRVAFRDAVGSTALVDSIYEAARQLRSGTCARKALIVVSDGMDNHSRYSKRELLDLLLESDAQVYTIAIDSTPLNRKPMEVAEQRRGKAFLDDLADETGGLSFSARGRQEIEHATECIARALRNRYNLGYVPAIATRDGRWRKIRVTVARPGLRACARTGYRMD